MIRLLKNLIDALFSFIHSFILVRILIPGIHTNNKPVCEGKIKRESYDYSRIFSFIRKEREKLGKGGTSMKLEILELCF